MPLAIDHVVREIAVHSDECAYKELFNLLFPKLKRFAGCILKSDVLAEEVASDVMISLWRNRASLLEVKNVMVYSFVMAKNSAINILKKKSHDRLISLDDVDIELSLGDSTPEQILIHDELRKKINNAIDELPSRCKMVFKLVKEDGMSYKEVAEVLSISSKTVDAHLVSAMKKIALSIKVEYNLI